MATVKGIYINQTTLENTAKLNYMIENAKASGINTFVIDFGKLTKAYQQNIELVKQSGIRYVARIIVFNEGGSSEQVLSQAYWEKRYEKVQQAIGLGAQEIQLDYIRYSSKQAPSPRNYADVVRVISWFKGKLAGTNIPLQADVFGIIGFRPEMRIGQDAKLIAPHVDAMCPMVYPSHFEPFREHAVTPYETIFNALTSFKKQFSNKLSFKLYPYIELSNYRWPLTTAQRHVYITAQLKAVRDVNADGWYAWSPNNYYDNLFHVLQAQQKA